MRKMLAALTCIAIIAATPSSGIDVSKTFARIARTLRLQAKIAVLLPTRLPEAFRGEKIFPVIQGVGPTEYAVDIALSPDCQGERACSEGHVFASTTGFSFEDVPPGGTPVRLTRSIVALYHPSMVGAHASDAYLAWKQNGAYYAIALNTGSLADIVLTARSMR